MTGGGLFNLARAMKVVALLLFLVPWATVSCGTERASMSGLDFVTGGVDAATGRIDGDLWVIAAAALILAGLAASFALPRARAALLAALGALGAAALIGFTILVRLPAELNDRAIVPPGGGTGAAEAGMNAQRTADLIRVEPEAGFWLVMAALIAAAALNLLARRRAGP